MSLIDRIALSRSGLDHHLHTPESLAVEKVEMLLRQS